MSADTSLAGQQFLSRCRQAAWVRCRRAFTLSLCSEIGLYQNLCCCHI
jgi:hypothetical protein